MKKTIKLKEITMNGLHQEIEKIIASKNKKYSQHLDIGCGSGALLQRLKKFTENRFGCDMSTVNYKNLKDVTFKKANIDETFPFEQQFDLITCIEVIEHVENQFNLVRQISKHLKKGGTCIISSPNNYSIFNKLYFTLGNNLIHFNNRNMLGTGHINPLFENIFLHHAQINKLKLISKRYTNGHIPLINMKLPLKTKVTGNVVIYEFIKI